MLQLAVHYTKKCQLYLVFMANKNQYFVVDVVNSHQDTY